LNLQRYVDRWETCRSDQGGREWLQVPWSSHHHYLSEPHTDTHCVQKLALAGWGIGGSADDKVERLAV
jgi:hypothetical protein